MAWQRLILKPGVLSWKIRWLGNWKVKMAYSTGVAIKTRSVVYATHMPPNINVFNFECAPYRSYVLAVKLHSGQYPDALIYDCQEPYHYVRSHTIDGQ